MQQLLANVEGGGCFFSLEDAVNEEPLAEEEEEGNEAEMKNLIAVHSQPNSPKPTPKESKQSTHPKESQESDKTSV